VFPVENLQTFGLGIKFLQGVSSRSKCSLALSYPGYKPSKYCVGWYKFPETATGSDMKLLLPPRSFFSLTMVT
jgi:hypothetical protein